MEIGEVLSKAWKIIWKHKILWLFGILASCSSTSSSTSNSFSNSFTYTIDQYPPWLDDLLTQTDQTFWISFLIIFACLGFILIAIFMIISIFGRLGLVRGALQGDLGTETLKFSELLRGGLPYFWRILGLTLIFILGIFMFIALFIAAGVGLTAITLGLALLCLLPLICLLIPLSLIITLILDQATNAIIIENTGIWDGVGRGWQVIRANPGVYALMGLILYIGIYFIGGTIIGLPLILATLPLIYGNVLGIDSPVYGNLVLTAACLILYLPVLLILYGIMNSYVSTSFTLTYLRLTTPKQPAATPTPDLPKEAPELAAVSS